MIQLTDAAAQHIKKIMAQHESSIGFRLSVKQTGCSGYMYVPEVVDAAHEEDVRVDTDQGITVFIDSDALPKIQHTQIDLMDERLGQQRLIYNNPNAESECGCGESFNLRGDSHEKENLD